MFVDLGCCWAAILPAAMGLEICILGIGNEASGTSGGSVTTLVLSMIICQCQVFNPLYPNYENPNYLLRNNFEERTEDKEILKMQKNLLLFTILI